MANATHTSVINKLLEDDSFEQFSTIKPQTYGIDKQTPTEHSSDNAFAGPPERSGS
jgi:hypothetical protein